jgi:hypothetical protein
VAGMACDELIHREHQGREGDQACQRRSKPGRFAPVETCTPTILQWEPSPPCSGPWPDVCEGVALAGWRGYVIVNIGTGGLGLYGRPVSDLHTLVSRAFDHDRSGAVLRGTGMDMVLPMNGLTATGTRPSHAGWVVSSGL